MLKYASKLLLEIIPSVLATVIGAYLANQYIVGRPTTNAPVLFAGATVDPKIDDANATSREAVKTDVTVSWDPSDLLHAHGPAGAIGSRIVDKANDWKAAPPIDKLSGPTSVPARLHRFAPRDKDISKTNTIAASAIVSLTVDTPELSRATNERFPNANANLPLDASSPRQEIGRDNGVSPLPNSGMTGSHLARTVLDSVIRTASLLRFTERLSSEQTRVSKDALASRRPETKTPRPWP